MFVPPYVPRPNTSQPINTSLDARPNLLAAAADLALAPELLKDEQQRSLTVRGMFTTGTL